MVFNKLTTNDIKKRLYILETRFVVCLLFFCCFSSVYSQIYVAEGTTFYNPDAVIKISGSTKKSDEKLSGTVYTSVVASATNSNEEGDFKNVKIENPEVRSVKKARLNASKSSNLDKIDSKKGLEKIPRKEFAHQFVFSDKIPSEIVFSTGSKFGFCVVSFSNPTANEALAVIALLDFRRIIIDSESDVFLSSDFVFSSHHFTSVSVRPPPFFV